MQTGFAHLLLIFILSLLVAGAAVFYLLPQSNSSETGQVAHKSVSSSPDAGTLQKETVYKSNLGFEFSVPEGFSVIVETEEDFHKRSNGEMRKNFTSTLFYPPADFVSSLYVLDENKDFEKSPLSIWIFKNPDNLDPQGFYKKYWYYPFIWGDFTSASEKIKPKEGMNIAEASGSGSVVDYRSGSPKFIYLPKDDKMYLFKILGSGNILKRFKFN